MAVKARPGETVDSLLRRFKKDVLKSEVLKDLSKHEYYVSLSEKRRRKDAEALKRLKHKSAKQKMY